MADRRESKRRRSPAVEGSQATVAQSQRTEPELSAGIWLVATPIGNAADVSLRALDVLRRADVLACEDTRQTRKLMDIHGIALNGRRMISYNDQNGAGRRPQIVELLSQGLSVAYASDAGTPLIADPGYRLVEAAREIDCAVHAVPGPSAVLAALSVAGLPTDRFLFMGFLPVKSAARRRELDEIADLRATLVLFESPRRLASMLADARDALGADRQIAVVRELTKKFEEVSRGSLIDLQQRYFDAPPKGEVVVVIGPPERVIADAELSIEETDRLLKTALQTMPTKDAAKQVARQTGLPRRELYQRAVALSRRLDES